MDRRLVQIVILAVVVVWTCSFLADILEPTYDPSPYVHIAMMAVVGAATAQYLSLRGGRKES